MTDVLRVMLSLTACGIGCVVLQRVAMRLTARGNKQEHSAPPLLGDSVALAAGLQTGCFFLLLTSRPGMAGLLTYALAFLLLTLNRVKEQVLHEPLVLADAWLLPQVWKYPEMYVPYLPVKGLLLGCAGIALVLAALVVIEPALPYEEHSGLFICLFLAASVPIVILCLLRKGCLPESIAAFLLRRLPVGHDAAIDAKRNGTLAAALMHPVLAGHMERNPPDFLQNIHKRPAASCPPRAMEKLLASVDATPPASRPHVVLIQAESFCDIRKHVDQGRQKALHNFLPYWDKLFAQEKTLPTPENAYGAYTMRTEFSMLTGLQAKDLGPFAFNPYLLAARQPLWSLARFFQSKGYATLCIHPYHKGFFRRDKVMANLGFQRFLDLDALDNLERFGPYISDAALGEKTLLELEASPVPLFCFIITMEAHGPWLDGRVSQEELYRCLPDIDLGLFTPEVQKYLCHLRHMDQLLGMLSEHPIHGRPLEILAYGDHTPGCLETT